MKNIYILLFLTMCICTCCTSSKKNMPDNDHIITFTANPKTYIPTYVDSISYLKLETTEQAFLSHINKVIIKGNKIFIGDFHFHKIVVYNDDGSFNFAIDKKGRASDEYLELKNFTIDDSAVYIIDNYRNKLMIYDVQTGSYSGYKKMPFMAWDVERLNNGLFVFSFSPLKGGKLSNNQPPYRLFFTDNNLNIIKQMFPYSEDEFDPIAKDPFFSSTKNEVVYNWCVSDSFVLINKENIDSLQIINVDFGNKKIPESFRHNWDLINNGYAYMYRTPIVNGRYIALEISANDYLECFLYDTYSKKLAINPTDKSYNLMLFPNCTDNKERFVYIIENKETYEEIVSNGFLKANEDIEKHLEDGIAILFYYMNKPTTT